MTTEHTPSKTYSIELLAALGDELAAQLKLKPAVVDSQPMTARQVVISLMPKILSLASKGYSIRAIHDTFTKAGVEVTLNTFKTYVTAVKSKAANPKVTRATAPTQSVAITAKQTDATNTSAQSTFGKPSAADFVKSKIKADTDVVAPSTVGGAS